MRQDAIVWRVSFLIDWNTKRFAGGIRLPISILQSQTTLRSILDTYFPSPRRGYPELFLLVKYTFPPAATPQGESSTSAVLPVSPEVPPHCRSMSPSSDLALSQASLSLQDSESLPENGSNRASTSSASVVLPSSPPEPQPAPRPTSSSSSSLLSSIIVLPGPPQAPSSSDHTAGPQVVVTELASIPPNQNESSIPVPLSSPHITGGEAAVPASAALNKVWFNLLDSSATTN